ncbi:MAG TPA: nicotinate (nicotinamide) nucleotide adenylyltransferase [Saprospiraceae bacterium]|nr:nicotinate (nicotinamide) nucleotide adenylyltransferase [Saprospiraceae bacterium]
MKIGLFFGSFNPIHLGHLIIANFMASNTDLNQVWFMVSPQNPFKDKKTLAPDLTRLQMIRMAIEDNNQLKVSDIEFSLPKPSYTITTLTYLKEKYPSYEFCLIMGSDNLSSLPLWKNYEQIINNYPIYIYIRPAYLENPLVGNNNIFFFDVPQILISASTIRKYIEEGKSIKYLVPEVIYEFLDGNKLYKLKK